MPETFRIFVSATSLDLGSHRRAVSETLLRLGALPVTQDHFAPDFRDVAEMLRGKLATCDAVICLIGWAYGRAPRNSPRDQVRRSYTQIEYEVAVELAKPIYVFVAEDESLLDAQPGEPRELRELQLAHRQRIVQGDRVAAPLSAALLAARLSVLRPAAGRGGTGGVATVRSPAFRRSRSGRDIGTA